MNRVSTCIRLQARQTQSASVIEVIWLNQIHYVMLSKLFPRGVFCPFLFFASMAWLCMLCDCVQAYGTVCVFVHVCVRVMKQGSVSGGLVALVSINILLSSQISLCSWSNQLPSTLTTLTCEIKYEDKAFSALEGFGTKTVLIAQVNKHAQKESAC